MNRKYYIIEIVLIIGLTFIFSILNIRICPFFYIFNIPCPGCGLTRSITFLLKGNINESIKYNILGLPLIVCCIIYILFFIFSKEYLINEFLISKKNLIIIIVIIIFIIVQLINIFNPRLY